MIRLGLGHHSPSRKAGARGGLAADACACACRHYRAGETGAGHGCRSPGAGPVRQRAAASALLQSPQLGVRSRAWAACAAPEALLAPVRTPAQPPSPTCRVSGAGYADIAWSRVPLEVPAKWTCELFRAASLRQVVGRRPSVPETRYQEYLAYQILHKKTTARYKGE